MRPYLISEPHLLIVQVGPDAPESAGPPLLRLEDAINDAINYSTKYHTKPDMVSAAQPTAEVSARLAEARAARTKREEVTGDVSGAEIAFRNLARGLHSVIGKVVYPSAMVAGYVLGFGDHMKSHETVVHPFRSYQNRVLAPVAGNDTTRAGGVVCGDAGPTFYTADDDYVKRAEALNHLNPFWYCALYAKKGIPKVKPKKGECSTPQEYY